MAFVLQFLNGARAGETVTLRHTSVWIGRDPRCDLALDAEKDLQVSARHAEIIQAGQTYQLRDTSSNGTFVNGQRVKHSLLKDGDLIDLGQGGPQLKFFSGAAADAAAPERGLSISPAKPAKLPLTAPEPKSPAPAEASPAPSGAAPAASSSAPAEASPAAASSAPPPSSRQPRPSGQLGALTPASGRPAHLRITLERQPAGPAAVFEQPVIRLGRDPSSDLALDPHADLLVSHNHAKIMCLEGQAVLFDTESRNGTFINDQRVSRQELQGGELLQLGLDGPRFRVTIGTALPAGATRAAGSKPPGATLFGAAEQFKDLSLGEAALLAEVPLAPRLTVGRSPDNTIVLDSMFVSAHHAEITKSERQVRLRDLGSANGVYLGGERISEAALSPGTEFVIGPYLLKHAGAEVLVFDTRTRTWVDAYALSRLDQRSGRPFLDRVSLKIQPGEFVCILGPSGCGKSTLLRCLNGSSRADSGRVLLNNIDFYAHHEALKHQVGYVPQDDIIHSQLSVWRTLQYAARLRLPPQTSAAERDARVRDVLSVLELYDHRQKPVARLSGGQRKRVSIAVELLTDPAIIYLDEPTSGLDPNLEEKMMLLLREMTLKGKTVVSVTHTLDNIQLADKLTFLVDGKLAFFGRQEQARDFFRVERMPDVYKRFEEHRGNAAALQQRFAASPVYAEQIASQLKPPAEAAAVTPAPPRRRPVGAGALRQLAVLTARYAEILTRDLRHSALLLLQAPIIALFICLAVATDQPERAPTSTLLMMLSLSALWFGCSNAAREITKEAPVYARERLINLRVIPYVASKLFVLQWLALIQVATMLLIVAALRGGYLLEQPPPACARWGITACSALILGGVPGSFGLHLLNLYLTALTGIGLGLLISALAGNSDKAMSLVPLLLIPQVLFSGAFGTPAPDDQVQRGVGYAMSLNWSLDQAKRIAMCAPEAEAPEYNPSAGCADCLHAFDPYKHRRLGVEAQPDDSRCRSVLPVLSQMLEFPESLQLVEDGLYTPPASWGQGAARDATKSSVGFYVLGGYSLLLLALVCLVMRLKDRAQR